jgi:HAD superfamily hydrolase (TIGR01509 family)
MVVIKAIVFDMDGLMVDSEPLARQAWETVLARYGCQLDAETYGRMIGLRTEDSSRLVRDRYDLAVSPADLGAQKTAEMAGLLDQGVPVMPGLPELIQVVNERQIPWAVATSSRLAYAQTILDQLGLRDSCRAVAAGDQVAHGKPAPDIYLLAANRLGVNPQSCLALEDSVPGGRAAVAAGMVLAAVPGPQADAADFAFADHVFPSLRQVADALDHLLEGAG